MSRTFKFRNRDLIIQYTMYSNRRVAIRLMTDSYELCYIASVNLPEHSLENDEIFIKNWGENAGVLEALEAADIVTRSHVTVATGFVKADLCILNHPEDAQFDKD